MFRFSLAPAHKSKVNFWRLTTGVTFTAGGGTCVDLAQLGVATSIMLLGYSVLGAFPPNFLTFVHVLIGIVALVLLVLFSSGLIFFCRQKSWFDLILGIVLLIPFVILPGRYDG